MGPDSGSDTRIVGAATLLGFVVLAAYGNSFRASFQFDDYRVIADNPVVHSWAGWLADLGTGIRPLLKLSYTFNWVTGPDAFGFHLFNVAVHFANTILVYLLGRGIARRSDWPERAAVTGALFAALLFAVHPANTEAVTYISGRSVSLMALFYLGGLLAYAHSVEADDIRWRWISLTLFIAALATKETAVTFPVAMLLWESTATGLQHRWTTVLQRQLPYWLVIVVAAAVIIPHSNYEDFFAASQRARGWQDNLLTQVNGVSYLIGQLIFLRSLNIDPDLPVIVRASPELIAQGVLLIAPLAGAAFAWRRNQRWVSFGILWFYLHLLPTNSVVPRLDVANDRQLYLPSVGVFLAVALALFRPGVSAVWPVAAAKASAVAGIMLLCALTMIRNRDYADEIHLWTDTVRQSPMKARAHNNLGYAYLLAHCNEEAGSSFRSALALEPDFWRARMNLKRLQNDGLKDSGPTAPAPRCAHLD